MRRSSAAPCAPSTCRYADRISSAPAPKPAAATPVPKPPAPVVPPNRLLFHQHLRAAETKPPNPNRAPASHAASDPLAEAARAQALLEANLFLPGSPPWSRGWPAVHCSGRCYSEDVRTAGAQSAGAWDSKPIPGWLKLPRKAGAFVSDWACLPPVPMQIRPQQKPRLWVYLCHSDRCDPARRVFPRRPARNRRMCTGAVA